MIKKISVIGLGYVGLPLSAEFSKKFTVVGYDIDFTRINELKRGVDRTNELCGENLNQLRKINLTTEKNDISDSNIYIITVPTPVDENNQPDLSLLKSASELVGTYLSNGDIVIYESTVFPGCTEEICVPLLEKFSKKMYNQDFSVGYSPERINPGDKNHTLQNITKIVSGSNESALKTINELYSSIINAPIYEVSSIKVAEAAKVIENTQRDVNIALINELAFVFDRLNIKTSEVLDAAATKWNFLSFKPGLVGGHCIGVDPYYLTYKALEVGYHPEMILAGRKINDQMGEFIVSKTIAEMLKQNINPTKSNVAVLGITFKENCPDIRNTKVLTIINGLIDHKCNVTISDCIASKNEVKEKLNFNLLKLNSIEKKDAIVVAVGHQQYINLKKEDWEKMLKPGGVLIDVKSILSDNILDLTNFRYWSL